MIKFLFLFLIVFLYNYLNAESILEKKNYSYYKIITERNLFYPLWKTTEKKEQITTQPKIDEKLEKEKQEKIRQEEEKRFLENKRLEIESNIILTGFINENKHIQALISNKKTNSDTIFVKEGDILFDKITVKKINNSKGEVILDYDNKFTVSIYQK